MAKKNIPLTFAALALVFGALLTTPVGAQVTRNAGKYGAMFSWWYDSLPRQTMYPPTVAWDARQQRWWNAMIRQAADAGLGWIAAACEARR